MAAEIFYAEDGEIYVCTTGSSPSSSTQYSDYLTEISVSGGERGTEQILLLGQTSNQQNSITRENPQEQYETSLTAIARDHSFQAMVNGDTSGGGDIKTVKGARDRTARDIYYRFDDGTSQIEIKFESAYGISTELSVDAEGYLEETINFNCLAKNYQYKYVADKSGGSTLF